MEQTDRTAFRNLIIGTAIGIILSRFTIGSILMTVPVLLVCPKIRNTGIKVLSFAAMLLGVAIWAIVEQLVVLGTLDWVSTVWSLFYPALMIIGSAVWTVGGDFSRSSMRKFFWASIPVFVLGVAMALFFVSDKAIPLRESMANMFLYTSEYLGVDFSSIVQIMVTMMALLFAPAGVLALALQIVIADVNVNRFDEDWQYDFANMKLPDSYVWVFFASWIIVLASNWVEAIPFVILVIVWNLALTMTVLYMVVGVSILVAFARRRTAAITAGRIVFTVVLLSFIPVLNVIMFIGLPVLGILETWIAFRSEN